MVTPRGNKGIAWRKKCCKEQCQVYAGEEDHAQIDNIKTWTGLSEEESIRMTEDRDKWRKYVHGGRLRNRIEHDKPCDNQEY